MVGRKKTGSDAGNGCWVADERVKRSSTWSHRVEVLCRWLLYSGTTRRFVRVHTAQWSSATFMLSEWRGTC